MIIALSVRFFGQPNVSLILAQWSCVAKYWYFFEFFEFFLNFSCSPHATSPTTPIHTDLCPSALILGIFAYPRKTSCPGKFPRPYGPKPCPVYQHMPMLTLFSCPPAPTYPIAPIRTHIYTFALVHTFNYNVYMYYLC